MAKSSGGTRDAKTGLKPGDFNFKGKVENIESLSKIRDPSVYREVKSAISRYHAVMGVRQRNVKLADLGGQAFGAHLTMNGVSNAVYLDKGYYNMSKSGVTNLKREFYKSGWATKTNKPVAHTVTHELAHATWNSALSGRRQKLAGKEIRSLYKSWMRDKRKTGYGRYAETNVNEFWAETVTKAIHGKADKYTTAVKSIAKKYKL